MADNAGPSQDGELAQFVAITNCQSDQAAFYIAAANGSFEQAVAMYYGDLVWPLLPQARAWLGRLELASSPCTWLCHAGGCMPS